MSIANANIVPEIACDILKHVDQFLIEQFKNVSLA